MLRVSGKVNVSGDVKPPRIVGSEDGQLGVCHATKRLKLCFKGENHRVELVSPFTVCNTPDVHMLKTANKAIIQNSNFYMRNVFFIDACAVLSGNIKPCG